MEREGFTLFPWEIEGVMLCQSLSMTILFSYWFPQTIYWTGWYTITLNADTLHHGVYILLHSHTLWKIVILFILRIPLRQFVQLLCLPAACCSLRSILSLIYMYIIWISQNKQALKHAVIKVHNEIYIPNCLLIFEMRNGNMKKNRKIICLYP